MGFIHSYMDALTGDKYEVWTVSGDRAYYVVDSRTFIDVDVEDAWCMTCNDMVSAERPPTPEGLEELKKELGKAPGEKLLSLDFGIDPEEMVSGYQERLEFLKNRQSPPRCLECCQANVVFMSSEGNNITRIPDGPVLELSGAGFADIERSGESKWRRGGTLFLSLEGDRLNPKNVPPIPERKLLEERESERKMLDSLGDDFFQSF